jgi:hypothetical protein
MIDSRKSGEPIIDSPADGSAPTSGEDEFVHATTVSAPHPLHHPHVTAGDVLWTLTHDHTTAQARCWATQSGFELEMHIWTGVRVAGQEDLCWSQLFTSHEALASAALAKKQQLEASGWLEEIETRAR